MSDEKTEIPHTALFVPRETLGFKPVFETSRTYVYPATTTSPEGARIYFSNVRWVCTGRPSHTHRLETADGSKFIVAAGWIAIEIQAEGWSF